MSKDNGDGHSARAMQMTQAMFMEHAAKIGVCAGMLDDAKADYKQVRKDFENNGGNWPALMRVVKLRAMDAAKRADQQYHFERYDAWLPQAQGDMLDEAVSDAVKKLDADLAEQGAEMTIHIGKRKHKLGARRTKPKAKPGDDHAVT